MNLSYLQAGKKPFIEIDSSPSVVASVDSSAERRVFDELFASLNEPKLQQPQQHQQQQQQGQTQEREPQPVTPKKLALTPKKQALTPISKSRFDLSSIFMKKDVEVINSSGGAGYHSSNSKSDNFDLHLNDGSPTIDENLLMYGMKQNKAKKVEPSPAIDEAVLKEEMRKIHEFARDALAKAHDMVYQKDIEILEQRTFYIQKIRDLSDKVTELLSENVMLKEIQNELEKSAEKITVFRSEEKSLSICSYLYDSWRNRESKFDLYQKFTAKSRAYDELLEKYADLEKAQTFVIPNPNQLKPGAIGLASTTPASKRETAAQKSTAAALTQRQVALPISKPPTPMSKSAPAPQVVEVEKRRRGRKPKVIEHSQYDIEILSDDDDISEPPLTKKALLAFEKETSSKRGFPQKSDQDRSVIALSSTSRKPAQSQQQKQAQQQQQQQQQHQSQSQYQSKKILDEKTSDYQNTRNRSRQQSQGNYTSYNQNNYSYGNVTPKSKSNGSAPKANEATKGRENTVATRNSYNSRSAMKRKDTSSASKGSEDEFDDNRSSTSAISSLNANKRDSKYKKLLAKERRKNMVETQETTFNSIADTLFNF